MRWISSLTRLGSLLLAVWLVAQAWEWLRPEKPPVSAGRREVAVAAAEVIVSDLRSVRGPHRTALVAHLEQDPSDCVTDALRNRLAESGTLDVLPPSLGERMRRRLGLREQGVAGMAEALPAGRSADAGLVLAGKVLLHEEVAGVATLRLEVVAAEVATGKVVLTRTYERSSGAPFKSVLGDDTSARGWGQRIAAWGLCVVLLPVFTLGFIRSMVQRRSNRVNAWVLGIYGVAACMLAVLILGAGLSSWAGFFLLLAAGVVATVYHVFIMTRALALES